MSRETDRALLRRFEPVIRYTRGERFFPMDVDAYVRESSLWVQRPREEARCLVPEGELTLEALAEPRTDGFEATYFLKFIEPMNIAELAVHQLREVRDRLAEGHKYARFRAGRGRLARVGYLSRLVDAIFSITLLARGRVSGGTAAAAAMTYKQMMAEHEHYVYYGRVVRRRRSTSRGRNGSQEESGWVALQYWFFYPFNSWRSGFFGVNDHEADWEMICVYLWEDAAGEPRPAWVAYASHDFHGDDLRRRWDDPELEKVDEHPVVYAGAGSHASYYVRGEYLPEIEISFLAPVGRMVDRLKATWRRFLKRASAWEDDRGAAFGTFSVPFVDYARGDGLSIGPGQEKTWEEPRLLDPVPGWALHYRGLWGIYVRDPISGENAPAGPLYNRDGTVRRAWYDPVGWAGLDKVPTPGEALTRLQKQRTMVEARRAALQETIREKNETLLGLDIEVEALQGQPHLKGLHDGAEAEIHDLAQEIDRLRARVAADDVLLEALDLHATRLEAGDLPPVRAHLHHPHYPASDAELRLGCLAESWAAISVGLMMMSLVALVLFAQEYLVLGLAALIALVVIIEAGFRRQLHRIITNATIALAVFAALIILYEFFWTIAVLAVLLAGGYLMVENLRELWR